MKKIIAALMAIMLLVSLASCGTKTAGEDTTTAQAETESAATTEAETSAEDTTAAPASETSKAAEEAESTTAAEGESVSEESTTEAKKIPQTKEEILAAYTEVMNQAKKDAPAFTKIEYQELPSDANSRQVSKGGAVINAALKVAGTFMTSEAKAKEDPEIQAKGNNMRSWPVCKSPKGCMLTDTSAIKSAKCEQLPDGQYKITLVLNAEQNPEPCADGGTTSPSKTGAVFSPLSRKEIDENLSGGVVSAVATDISYNITYHDCMTSVTYNPENNHVSAVDQTTYVTIKGQGKVVGLQMIVDKQELIDYMHIYDIKY